MLIVAWGQGAGSGSSFARLFRTMLEQPMLGISTGGRSGGESITPLGIAVGTGDGYLIALNQALHEWGRPIFLRSFAEMNGPWNAYSAYN